MNDNVYEATKNAADTLAAITGISVAVGWLPTLAAVFTVIWLGLRAYNELLKAIKAHRQIKVDTET